jgi:hypothetical protein
MVTSEYLMHGPLLAYKLSNTSESFLELTSVHGRKAEELILNNILSAPLL